MMGVEIGQSAAAWSLTAAASFTAASATIAAANFASTITTSLTMVGVEVGATVVRNLDGWKPKRASIDIEEEDIMFLMAAIQTTMERNNVNH
jgi:hypothetical protein